MSDKNKKFIHLTSHAHELSWKTEVIGEADTWICLNKQTHLGTEHDHHHQDRPHMQAIVEQDIKRQAGWMRERGIDYLRPANILDFETTGASLWGKNESGALVLKDCIHSEKPNRFFHALVHGSPEEEQFEVDLRLTPHRFQPWIMKASKEGKKTVTQFEVLEKFQGYTLLKCIPVTERYHQVRAHLGCRKLPVVGDAIYGGGLLMLSEMKRNYRQKKDRPERPLLDRAAIHLTELHFPDPISGEDQTIKAPMQHDWEVAFKYLRKYATGN